MAENFSWLRKTTYIGSGGRHFGSKQGVAGLENKVGVYLKQSAEEEVGDTRDSQIRTIQGKYRTQTPRLATTSVCLYGLLQM
jgi:hypothetical protein